ncbi:hypothetical protein AwWohl_07160 [Gammaproteobacteria bacterium]|nr:hypothetical protein AwWohl_07160 [Gammaproteobacteria bacterium]
MIMFEKIKNNIFVLSLLSLFALTGFLSWKLQYGEKEEQIDSSHIPSLLASDFTMTQYDQNGLREYTLDGVHLTNFKENTPSTIEQPFLTHFSIDARAAQIDWTVASKHAFLSADRELLTLKEAVHLIKHDQDTGKTTNLRTSILYITEDGHRIQTDQFVTLLWDHHQTKGIGMIGFPYQNQFSLLNEVKSIYETP